MSKTVQNDSKQKRMETSMVASLKLLQGRNNHNGVMATDTAVPPASHNYSQGCYNALCISDVSPAEDTDTNRLTNNIHQRSQDICRRVPSREIRRKRASNSGTPCYNKAVVISPVNALDDALYSQPYIGSSPEGVTSVKSKSISQSHGAVLVSW